MHLTEYQDAALWSGTVFRFPAKYPFESTVDLMVHGAPSGWVFLTDMPRTAKPCTMRTLSARSKS